MTAAVRLLASVALGALIATVHPASAQRTAAELGEEVPASAAVRAELASVLLNSRRYAEAAREYRRLVESDSRNSGYRLGLARALAWGERYREAEPHLRVLAAQRRGDATVDALLRSVRANITPSAREAESWLAERPGHTPYRLELARALVREGQAQRALPHYHTLLAARGTADLLRETADAHAAANDRAGGIALIERHLPRMPGDAGVRRLLASLLAEDGRFTAALAQNDTALSIARTPDVLVDRARIQVLRGDLPAAEADLRRSLAMGATADALLMLGDVHRWQGAFDEARVAYEHARSLRPRDRAVVAAFAQLAREERPAPVTVYVPGEESGSSIQVSIVRDNAGIDYSRLGVRRGFGLRSGFTGSAGLEYRELREATSAEEIASSGFAADVAVARSVIYGPVYGSIGARAGVVHHFGEDVMTAAGLAVRGGYEAWIVAFDVATGPAYPTLLSAASLMPTRLERRDRPDRRRGRDDDDDDDDERPDRIDPAIEPLRERRLTLSAGGPIGLADAAISWQRADISDGNQRSSFSLSASYPLATGLSAVYSGSSISYAERSQLYWDPDGYLSSAAGIAYAQRRTRGFSFGGRFLLGLARADESPFLRVPVGEREATSTQVQLNLDSELGYRRGRWEVAAAYAFGRVGPYQRSDATITVRIVR